MAIRSSLACGALVGVIVLDERGRYLGSYAADFFAESLAIWAAPNEGLAERIRGLTIFGAALRFPEKRITPGEGFVAAINENRHLGDALAEFRETEAPFLATTDARGVFKGVLTYDRVARVLLAAVVR